MKSQLILAVGAWMMSATVMAAIITPKDTICESPFMQLGDGCYFFSTTGMSWYNALKDCHSKNAKLVTIETAEENEYIRNQILALVDSRGYNNDWWIGGYDSHQEGDFVWCGNFGHVTYNDWCSGDPNNLNVENCIHMTADCQYHWQDYNCDFEYDDYICEL